ncbi:CsgE family curli-type amyloid fiber assembly protein [Namhaeicola litoreus]|uniref:Curli production assembly/transport component CsgE n=1 Tax=Namhaeicola litoreus TaxID=1052145 RepID=A0ABW3XYA6_9FLAO
MKWFGLFFFMSIGLTYAQDDQLLQARLNISREDIFVNIEGIVENNSHVYNNKLSYHLLTLKKMPQDIKFEKNDRFGEFTLLPNENKTVTTLRINLEEEQELKVYFFVRDQKNLIAQDSIVINEVVDLLKTTVMREIDIEIKGLVIETTKTKMGKDFYDFFYQLYLREGAEYSFIINIEEKPFLGTGSLISVIIEDQTIFEFQARPDVEMLEGAAKYALVRVNEFNKNKQNVPKVY